MANNTFVEIDIPEARGFADLTGIDLDFQRTNLFANQLKEMLERDPPDYSLVEPMTTAILVLYSRPFMTGVRQRIVEDDLSTLSQTQREAHNRFRDWRDKHIAHSVNVFEENQPIARYWIERFDDEGFTSVECISTITAGMCLDDVEMIIELASHFSEKFKQYLNHEKKKVLEVVRSLPKEQILNMAKKPNTPHVNDVSKVRKS